MLCIYNYFVVLDSDDSQEDRPPSTKCYYPKRDSIVFAELNTSTLHAYFHISFNGMEYSGKTERQEHPLDCACQAEQYGMSSGRKDSLVV